MLMKVIQFKKTKNKKNPLMSIPLLTQRFLLSMMLLSTVTGDLPFAEKIHLQYNRH